MYTYHINSLNDTLHFKQRNPLFDTLHGVFFALILFCSSFLTPYIGCNYQYIMKVNPSIRYLILFFVIYFSINVLSPYDEVLEHPMYDVIRSVFILLGFILLNNINVNFILIIMTFFAILVITAKFYSYYKNPILQKEIGTRKKRKM